MYQVLKKFEGVEVMTEANIYLDGKVQSRTVFMPDGNRKTLGVMLPGDYEFCVGDREVMEVIGGSCTVEIIGEGAKNTYKAGETFGLPAGCRFKILCGEIMQYICSYYKE